MASVDDLEELIATRKLNGVNDNLYKEDSNIEDVEKLKSLLYEGRLTQYGKRMLIKYYENEIQRQKEIIEDYQRMYCRAINENIPKQKVKALKESVILDNTIVGGRRNAKTLEYGIKLGKIKACEELLEENK